MCKHTWQLLGMLGNVLDMLCNVLGVLSMLFCKVLGMVVHYSHDFTAYKAASEGVFLRCGTPRTLQKSMPRTPRMLQACLGRCKPYLGRCKPCLGCCKACRGRPRMLPSRPRSCQACLHILKLGGTLLP